MEDGKGKGKWLDFQRMQKKKKGREPQGQVKKGPGARSRGLAFPRQEMGTMEGFLSRGRNGQLTGNHCSMDLSV